MGSVLSYKNYIDYTCASMSNLLSYTSSLNTYSNFNNSIKDIDVPRIFIIERNSNIKKSFLELDLERLYGTKL